MKIPGVHKLKSIAVNVPDPGCKYVYEPSFIRHRLFSEINFKITLPLLLFESEPHTTLWALKSPSNIYGEGSCAISCSNAGTLSGSLGGKYKEHTVKTLPLVTVTASACKVVLRVI